MSSLSVLVPHYNDPGALALSLRSIEAQTWQGRTHVIVYDDGSEPTQFSRAEHVVAGAALPVTLLRGARNRGRPYARNVLLDAADGKYTAWLDAGDEWYPNKTQEQLDGLYRARLKGFTQPIWMTCAFDWQWVERKPSRRRQRVQGDQVSSLLLGELSAYLWTLVARTEDFRSVGYFDLNLPRLQDLDFFLRFAEKGGLFMLPDSDEPLCVYHKSDIGRRGDEVLRCYKYLFAKHAALMLARSRRFRRNRQQHIYMHAARFTSNNGDDARTLAYLATAALMNPLRFGRLMQRSGWRL